VWAQSNPPDSVAEVTVTRSSDTGSEPDGADPVRSDATEELWAEVRVDPIKIALPNGSVGYTLRAYRPAGQLTPTDAPAAPDEAADDPFAALERTRVAQDPGSTDGLGGLVVEDEDGRAEAAEEPDPEEFQDDGGLDREAEGAGQDADEQDVDEDLPVFLSHRGRLLLFGSPESLVAFIGSDAPHDLAQLDTWATVVKRVRAEDVVPTDEDTYELDLVVENLRGGHDAWDLDLLIFAGQLARDLGWALRLEPVIGALSTGSPLDDLDELLWSTADGGIGGFVARRRLRRIGAQQASLGWRTVIGKISGAVDWRD
jgi:hypothetical protein